MIKKITLVLVFIILSVITYLLYSKHTVQTTIIEIKKGESVKEIAKQLKEKNIIDDWRVFYYYTRIKQKPLKAGVYEFSGELNTVDVWKILENGKEKLFKITIVPGDNLFDIAEKLDKNKIISKEKFLKFVFNPENVKAYKLKGLSFEGYFPPETYLLRRNSDINYIVKAFLFVFNKKYRLYEKDFKEISFYDAMKIASMVEKETKLPEEKPLIAGIIINRLKKRMYLQIDPTVIYGLELTKQWNGKLIKKDMKINTPFNTYLHYGLPPTPICSFGLDSLLAVKNHKNTDYLYYVANGESHIFSKSYKEHLRTIHKIKKSKH